MKKTSLITLLLFLSMLMCAQQEFSGKQMINLYTCSSMPDSLYNGHNYNYYNVQFKNATAMRNTGIVITSIGVALFAAINIAANSSYDKAEVVFYSSVAAFSIGVPLWIAGGVKRKNNRKAMRQIRNNTSITFRATQNGVGLSFNF